MCDSIRGKTGGNGLKESGKKSYCSWNVSLNVPQMGGSVVLLTARITKLRCAVATRLKSFTTTRVLFLHSVIMEGIGGPLKFRLLSQIAQNNRCCGYSIYWAILSSTALYPQSTPKHSVIYSRNYIPITCTNNNCYIQFVFRIPVRSTAHRTKRPHRILKNFTHISDIILNALYHSSKNVGA